FIDANNSGIMPKAIWAGGSTDNPGDYFKNGDVGIYFSGSWNYNAFANDIKSFKWGVMPSPRGKVGRSAILGGTGLAVPKNAPNRQLAEDFIKWLYTNPTNFKIFLDVDKGMSSLKGVTYAPPSQQGKADYEIMQAEVDNVTRLFSVDEDSYWRTYKDNEYRDYLKQAVNGDLSAADALNAFARELSESSKWVMAK
ncbi:MAG: extracellular solute-binding protein, partial [Treponema sp.]|nr:extracellular solute-binding protein [Treponema sp.]